MNNNLKTRLKEFFQDRITEPDYITTVYDLTCMLEELQQDQYNNWNQDIKELEIIINLMDAAGLNETPIIY